MNYQFFGTAGIITAILIGLFVIFGIAGALSEESDCCDRTTITLYIIGFVCFGIAVLFWVVVGIICGLNNIWGWGLVK